MDAGEYDKLLAVQDTSVLGVEKTIRAMGCLIDLSSDLGRIEGIAHAIKVLGNTQGQALTPTQKTILNYFLGNAWSAKRVLSRTGTAAAWDWQQEELEKEIASFRIAIQSAREGGLPPALLCEVFTNLANALNHVGRFVEALSYWDRAITVDAKFSMATGNKGVSLFHYATMLYDQGHAVEFLKVAYGLLCQAVKGDVFLGAQRGFEACRQRIETLLRPEYLSSPPTYAEFSLGDTDEERAYRKWCLQNCLFLNPLNDLGPYSIAACDVFSNPPIVVKIHEGPYYHGFFNQMKQEYVSARLLYYEGTVQAGPHYSDKDVLLYNTLDYPCYGLCIEKQKLAFRAAYSLLDKTAYFLNHYLGLGILEKRVSFKSLWYLQQTKPKGLRSEFASRPNWPLRGLFWLAKDLYEDEAGFRDMVEPEAQLLAEVRNHLEHKYLKIHEDIWPGPHELGTANAAGLADTLAFSIHRTQLADRGMMMLRLARSALVYLSLGVHEEERKRAATRSPQDRIGTIPLLPWEDDW
jgi:tetratricopeptide (TPR) repeat protein